MARGQTSIAGVVVKPVAAGLAALCTAGLAVLFYNTGPGLFGGLTALGLAITLFLAFVLRLRIRVEPTSITLQMWPFGKERSIPRATPHTKQRTKAREPTGDESFPTRETRYTLCIGDEVLIRDSLFILPSYVPKIRRALDEVGPPAEPEPGAQLASPGRTKPPARTRPAGLTVRVGTEEQPVFEQRDDGPTIPPSPPWPGKK